MGRKAWLHPRIKKLVKPHLLRTKSGDVKVVDSYLHEYPHAEKIKKEKEKEKNPEKKTKTEPKESKMKKDLEQAKKDMACKLDA